MEKHQCAICGDGTGDLEVHEGGGESLPVEPPKTPGQVAFEAKNAWHPSAQKRWFVHTQAYRDDWELVALAVLEHRWGEWKGTG